MVQNVQGHVLGGWWCGGNRALQCWGLSRREWHGWGWSFVSGTAWACVILPELLQPLTGVLLPPLRKGVGKWRESLAEVVWEAETGCGSWDGCLGRKHECAPPAKVENPLVKGPHTHQ